MKHEDTWWFEEALLLRLNHFACKMYEMKWTLRSCGRAARCSDAQTGAPSVIWRTIRSLWCRIPQFSLAFCMRLHWCRPPHLPAAIFQFRFCAYSAPPILLSLWFSSFRILKVLVFQLNAARRHRFLFLFSASYLKHGFSRHVLMNFLFARYLHKFFHHS